MLLIQILILFILLIIFLQDLKSRAIHWVLLPVLVVLFVALRYLGDQRLMEILQELIKNMAFLLLLFVLVSAYFSLKQRRWVNITMDMIGWGDILFMVTVAFYLSILNFLLFYVVGLIASLLAWVSWQAIDKSNEDRHIPLAGLLAGALSVILVICWWLYKINLTNDEWVMSLLIK